MADLVQAPESTQVLTLDDGRKVSLAICGDPNGHPVVFFHPLQGNRFMALTFHKLAKQHGLRIISVDRPGIGKSDRLPGRQVAQSTADLLQVLDHLGVHKFSALAMSAGTMYALAAAVSPATRNRIVGKVMIIAPWIPPSSREAPRLSPLQSITRFLPRTVMAVGMDLANCVTVMQVRGNKQVVDLMSRSSEAEKAAFAADPDNQDIYSAMINEWIAQGGNAYAEETQLCLERSFNLHFNYIRDVKLPVTVYAGISDQVIDYTHVKYWHDNADARNVELISVPGGTHDGLIHTYKQELMQRIAADIGAAAAGAV